MITPKEAVEKVRNAYESLGFNFLHISYQFGGVIQYTIEGNKIPTGQVIHGQVPAWINFDDMNKWIKSDLYKWI